MMRVTWRTSVFVALCLLRTEERHSGGGPIKLSASDAFDTREQCRT